MATWTTDVEIDGQALENVTLNGLTITYGRQIVSQQPEPTSILLTLIRDSSLGTVDVSEIRIGAKLVVNVTITGQTKRTRFFGWVTDVSLNQDTVTVVGVATGIYVLRQLRAVVPEAYIAGTNATAGLVAFAWIAKGRTLLDVDFTAYYWPSWTEEGGAVGYGLCSAAISANQLLNSYELVLAAVQSVNGVLWEDLRTADADNQVKVIFAYDDARDASLASTGIYQVNLTNDEILYVWEAELDLSSFASSITIEYNGSTITESGGNVSFPDASSVSVTDSSASTLGSVSRSFRTNNSYGSGSVGNPTASDIARELLTWTARPGYVVDVTVPVATFSNSRAYDVMMGCFCGNRWDVPSIATGLPTKFYLEGYRETISRHDWLIEARLSDVRNSWYGQPWNNVTPTLEWGQVGATVDWLDLSGQEL